MPLLFSDVYYTILPGECKITDDAGINAIIEKQCYICYLLFIKITFCEGGMIYL